MNTNVATIDRPSSVMAVVRNDLEKMAPQFEAALPKHIPVERFKRVVMTAIQNNPDLLNCEPRSLWNAAMRAAQDGLLPDSRDGAIVAYGKVAQWMPMIGGIRKKVRNSGEIATWDAHVVYEKDDFAFELGDEPIIRHKPCLTADRGKVIAAYSVAVLKSGEKSREVMTIAEIEAVRKRSRAAQKGPWVTDFAEMCRKTVARRHSKQLPMSSDLDDLLRRDDEIMDPREEVRERQRDERKSGTNVLDVFAGAPNQAEEVTTDEQINQDTGEITDESPPKQIAKDATEEPSAADAYERGRQAHEQGKALKAVPPEWRSDEPQALAEAWAEGWRSRDAEVQASKKGK